MKVEYPLLLVQKFNRKILTNKVFTYFLSAFIIAFIIILRDKPYIYYKYLYNPFILIILILLIVIITTFNKLLGIMLTILLIALFFPKMPKYDSIENFENEGDELVVIPVSGEDKNIVDDEKIKKNSEDSEDDDKSEDGSDSEEKPKNTTKPKKTEATKTTEKPEKPKKTEKKEKFKDDKTERTSVPTPEIKSDYHKNSVDSDSLSSINLEQIHVGFFKNKEQEEKKANPNLNSKEKFQNKVKRTRVLPRVARLSQIKENNSRLNNQENKENNKENFKTTKKSNDSNSFIGDVRKIINDLDKGKNKMNAKNAIKEINTLMFSKHRSDIQRIIDSDGDDEDDDDSEDDDYY
jgi:hypothetical protein